jgi:hypothetical protein
LRSIYLDETGISVNEPVALVAAVIINEDTQWRSVEKVIAELVVKYVPEEHRDGFSFHTKDLYHCSGKVFHHTRYPRERSREALKELLSIPRRFHLPVSVGYITKSEHPTRGQEDYSAREKAQFFHSLAYFLCVCAAEIYMMRKGAPEALARLVAENNTDTQAIVKVSHKILQGKYRPDFIDDITAQFGDVHEFLPIRRIVDTVHFAEKGDAILLQIADACAFILRYWAEGKSGHYVDPYFEAFLGDSLDLFLSTPRTSHFQGTWNFDGQKVA